MKDFLNLIITLALIGFAVGLTLTQINDPDGKWGLLYIPLIILYVLWGCYLNDNYKK